MWRGTLTGGVDHSESGFTTPDFREEPRGPIMRLLHTAPVSGLETERDVPASLRLLNIPKGHREGGAGNYGKI
jgi:hypothetical protein